MTRLTDATLRRAAWALCALCVLAFVIALGAHLVSEEPQHDVARSLLREGGNILVLAGFPVTAVVILRSQPRNKIGWLVMAIALVWSLFGALADSYARFGLVVSPGSLPAPEIAALMNALVWVPGIGLMGTFLLLLFPDGQLPSPRWRPVALLSGLVIASLLLTLAPTPGELGVGAVPRLQNPLGWKRAGPVLTVLQAVLLPMLPVCVIACAAALVLRFRRSHGVERLQLKWLTTAAAAVAGLYLLSIGGGLLTGALFGGRQPGWMDVLDELSFLAFVVIPAAIGTAVLRHRLYDIDVVINRTLVYGALTLTLAACYVSSVLLLQLVFDPVTKQSHLAVAASTLFVAALFQPARQRIQAGVDRRFYRSRYDTARTLDAFANRLRSELDLDAIGSDLRTTAANAVHPEHVSLWIRP